jgi:hypothetical protein
MDPLAEMFYGSEGATYFGRCRTRGSFGVGLSGTMPFQIQQWGGFPGMYFRKTEKLIFICDKRLSKMS